MKSYYDLKKTILNDLSDPRHGTSKVVAFSYNCQCEKCRAFVAQLKQEVHSNPSHEMHGTRNAFVYLQCRCARCTAKFNKKEYSYRREFNWKRNGIINFGWVQFLQMLVDQNNKCAICGQEVGTTGDVDHDHKTGKARAILCHQCNSVVAAVERARSLNTIANSYLIKAFDYIEKHMGDVK